MCCDHGGLLTILLQDISQAHDTTLWQVYVTQDTQMNIWQHGQVAIKVSFLGLFCKPPLTHTHKKLHYVTLMMGKRTCVLLQNVLFCRIHPRISY